MKIKTKIMNKIIYYIVQIALILTGGVLLYLNLSDYFTGESERMCVFLIAGIAIVVEIMLLNLNILDND